MELLSSLTLYHPYLIILTPITNPKLKYSTSLYTINLVSLSFITTISYYALSSISITTVSATLLTCTS